MPHLQMGCSRRHRASLLGHESPGERLPKQVAQRHRARATDGRAMNGAKRVLAILDECGPGDAARIGFCLSALRKALPRARIVLMVAERAAPVVERSLLVDEVVVSRLYGPGRRSRVGYSNRLPRLLTTDLGRYDPFGDPVEQNLAILNAAGIHAAVLASPDTVHDEKDVESVHDLLDRFGSPRTQPLVLLHTGSDWARQQWLPERWAEMADSLSDRYRVSLVFSGAAEDSAYIEDVRRKMRSPSVSLAGQTTVSQLGALVAEAQLCICVDTMVYELAQAAGTSTVVLAGPTRPHPGLAGRRPPVVVNRTGPDLRLTILTCQQQYPEGVCHRYECPMAGLREISVHDVLAEVEAGGVLSGPEVSSAPA